MIFARFSSLCVKVTARGPIRHLACGFVFSGLALMMVSCAYHAGSGDRQIPGGYRAIAVPVFKNQSHETGIEVYFTNSIIRELERAHIGTVVDKQNSQVTLEGIIDNVSYTAVNPQDIYLLPGTTILNTAYNITLGCTLRLRRNSDERVLWEASFRKDQSYQTPKIGYLNINSVNALYNHSARNQNIEAMAADMMAEAHDRMTENF